MRLGLSGFVCNRTDSVWIEAEGDAGALDSFLKELTSVPPPASQIERVWWEAAPLRGESSFSIEPSDRASRDPAFVPADLATCDDCLRELFDGADRRYRYPFIACAACGPRLTVIDALPYDRARTTMSAFPLCAECRREYDDPSNRRFHAEATACSLCGPRLSAQDGNGHAIADDPLAAAVAALRSGRIVAVKGVGGFHLACDARRPDVVAELRRRKQRDAKPFAVMVADLADAESLAEVSPAECQLLSSARRPIVLLRRRKAAAVADDVAPGNAWLGVMLPYAPLHHLLLHDLDRTPLVMTSGNRSDEPIASADSDAFEQLRGIADLFLTHDRHIRVRCDDSVTRLVGGAELPVRRARGQAPRPIPLPLPCPVPVLALGGELKSTFAFGRDKHAVLSHHLGDLGDARTGRAYVESIEHYQRLFEFTPSLIVHDLHPDYATTRYAVDRCSTAGGSRRLAVQHHHAHLAACMADNGLVEPVLGVIFDGSGLGDDGTLWGGEFLAGDYRGYRRLAHLRPVALPGGDRAAREPWRVALAHLLDAGVGPALLAGRIPAPVLRIVSLMIERGLNAPLTSSAGRLFDAVAAIAGVRDAVSYEGQAAIELEALAVAATSDSSYPFEITDGGRAEPLQVDTRPLIAAVASDVLRGVGSALVACRFHAALVEVIGQVCALLRARSGLGTVALSGGVFLNTVLLTGAVARLERDGFRVIRHRLVPPGDGGLSLGQLVIAAAAHT